MKPVASTMTEIDHLEGDEVKFTISDANSAWVMRSMADLYSNRELAVVREYSTNAYDSNKEKALAEGSEVAPIHVTLPNAMNPYFSVQDYGVGMSERELKEVYTQFGESTKRDGRNADEFNGMLGFGSKSAVAYTNSFTITAIKDGHKTVGAITRREDAMGGYLLTLKIVLSVETSEPNGVTIQVPVHNHQEFSQKARDFYRFWRPGTVLINGKEPEWAVGEKIDNNLYYYETQGYNDRNSFVVMGNVPYRINNPDALFPQGMNRISFVAYVPVGAVEFTPSREALKYSDHTKNNLKKIISDFVTKSVQLAKDEIANCTSHAEAYKAWAKWRKVIGTGQVDDLTFKGDKLVERFEIKGSRWNTHGGRYSTDHRIERYSIEAAYNTLFVTGFPSVDNLNAGQKKKANAWRKMKNIDATYIFFTENDKVVSPWVDPARVVQWEKVKKEAPRPAPRPRVASVSWGRKAGSFDLVSQTGRENEQDVPSTKPLYYIMVKEYNNQEDRRSFAGILREFDIKEKVVLLPANRKDKFLRFYPHAKPVMDELRTKVELDWEKLICADGKTFFDIDNNDRRILGQMQSGQLDDPQLDKFIAICAKGSNGVGYMGEYNKHRSLAYMLGMGDKFKDHPFNTYGRPVKYNPLSEYPLAYHWNTYSHNNSVINRQNKHIIFYLNALYAARKDGKNV